MLATLLAAAGGAAGAATTWTLALAAVTFAGSVALGLFRPALFLVALLLARPLLDQFSGDQIHIGVGTLNVNGALGLVLLAVFFGMLVAASRVTLPQPSRTFALVVGVSGLAAVYAYEKFGSDVGRLALSEEVRLAAMLGMYVLATNVVTTPERVRLLFKAVVISALVPSLVGIIQFAAGNVPTASGLNIERVFSTFSGPNALGMYLALPAVILIAARPQPFPGKWRFLMLATIVVALVLSYSRSGYAMLIIGVVAVEYRRLSRRIFVAALVAAAVVIAVPSVHDRVLPSSTSSATAQPGGGGSAGVYSSLTWRVHNWKGLLGKWEQSPIVGFGLRSTDTVNPGRSYTVDTLAGSGFDAHNAVVRALVEGGLVLLLAWIALWISVLRSSARQARDPWELRDYARVVFGFWVAVVAIGLTSDDPYAATAMMYALFALTGGLAGAHRAWRRGSAGPA